MSENIEISIFDSSLDLPSVEDIFFMTAAVKDFSSDEAKKKFKYKYFGLYLENYPELVLVAKKGEKVLGYCLGSAVTNESFYPHQPHLEVFSDLYEAFGAHLHINLHPEAQGLGIGQKLVTHWEKQVVFNAPGMHIMTSPAARNVSFYRRLGFSTEIVRKYQNHEILFMGKNF